MVRCSRTRARDRQLGLLRSRAILDIVLYGRRVRRGVDLRIVTLLRLMRRVMLIGGRVLCEDWFIRRWWRITLARSLTQSIAIAQACSKRQTRMAGRRRHDGRDENRDATRAEGQLPVSSKKGTEGKEKKPGDKHLTIFGDSRDANRDGVGVKTSGLAGWGEVVSTMKGG